MSEENGYGLTGQRKIVEYLRAVAPHIHRAELAQAFVIKSIPARARARNTTRERRFQTEQWRLDLHLCDLP